MNGLESGAPAPGYAIRLPRWVARFLPWLRRRRGAVAMAGLLSFAVPVTFMPGVFGALREPSAEVVLALTAWYAVLAVELWAMLLLVGYLLEQRRPAQRYPRVAMLLAACATAAVVELGNGRAEILVEQGVVQSEQASHAQGFLAAVLMALLYFAHLHRSRAREEAAARLAAAQAAQHETRRRVTQARLTAMQARIDPQLLFQLLDEVRRAYEQDATRAERLLDELVTFLHEALPRLHALSSDVKRESRLARTYAQLRALAAGIDFDLKLDVAGDVEHARFPPGILLPLLDDALRGAPATCTLAGARAADATEMALTLAATPLDTTISRVRVLLADLYGTKAQLTVAPAAGAVRAVVSVPYEHA